MPRLRLVLELAAPAASFGTNEKAPAPGTLTEPLALNVTSSSAVAIATTAFFAPWVVLLFRVIRGARVSGGAGSVGHGASCLPGVAQAGVLGLVAVAVVVGVGLDFGEYLDRRFGAA